MTARVLMVAIPGPDPSHDSCTVRLRDLAAEPFDP